jgi:YidC/Oxa1 family membrane protein insertase
MTNPEAFSLNGAAWWSPEEKYEKRKYPKFVEDGPLNLEVTGGWIGLSQHYFLAAWIPQKDQARCTRWAPTGRCTASTPGART